MVRRHRAGPRNQPRGDRGDEGTRIDISSEFPKPWTDEVVRAAYAVITMGCGDACPVFPSKRHHYWAIEDPQGVDVDAIRPIRDEIEHRVLLLLRELGVPAPREARQS
jgi:arsenate reductase